MEDVSALANLGIIIGAGVIAAFVATKLKLPSILGYLIAGVVISLAVPQGINSTFVQELAQLGAALLLFAIGVEFSVATLQKVRNLVIVGAISQAFLVIIFCLIVLPALGFNDYQSFFIGILVSSSSTAFVVKMLETRDELHTHAGQIMLGWLVVQDVLIVVWFLLLKNFAPNADVGADLISAIINSAIVIGVTFGAGKYLLPPLMRQVASTHSDELLVVTVIGIIGLFALFCSYFGVSFTIGAFLAGLALSESFLNHEIFTEIKPIRNLCMLIFFVSIGALFNVNLALDNIGPIVIILLLVLAFKLITIAGLNLWFNVHLKTALKVGLGISQIGEFAFLGAQLGLLNNWIPEKIYTILITVTVLSMCLTPLLYSQATNIYKLLERYIRQFSPNMYRSLFTNGVEDDVAEKGVLKDHVILCGYGRVGSFVAQALERSHIPFIVIEMDTALIEKLKAAKLPNIYGDAHNPDILKSAGIESARALVVATPSHGEIVQLVKTVKELNPKMKIVARAGNAGDELEVDMIVEPEFEAAIQIITTLYKLMNRRHQRAVETIRLVKGNA